MHRFIVARRHGAVARDRSTSAPVASIEQPLQGGMDNPGGVVRVGDTVRRTIKRHGPTKAVRALLLHLEEVGFDGAPRYLGIDERGREVLSYVEGDVALAPYPAWSMTDSALTSVGRLLRRFHDATASFDRDGLAGWMTAWADPTGGDRINHNDPCPENIVFRDGEAVALIDFDLAAPGRPLWDVAIAARNWCPLTAPSTRFRYPEDLDAIVHLRHFAHGYGVATREASLLVDLIFLSRQRALAHIRDEVAAGTRIWVEEWTKTDGERRAAEDERWLDEHRLELVAALSD
jgi:Ser/Thr protein kinase RdoA (MazF antagonist)